MKILLLPDSVFDGSIFCSKKKKRNFRRKFQYQINNKEIKTSDKYDNNKNHNNVNNHNNNNNNDKNNNNSNKSLITIQMGTTFNYKKREVNMSAVVIVKMMPETAMAMKVRMTMKMIKVPNKILRKF